MIPVILGNDYEYEYEWYWCFLFHLTFVWWTLYISQNIYCQMNLNHNRGNRSDALPEFWSYFRRQLFLCDKILTKRRIFGKKKMKSIWGWKYWSNRTLFSLFEPIKRYSYGLWLYFLTVFKSPSRRNHYNELFILITTTKRFCEYATHIQRTSRNRNEKYFVFGKTKKKTMWIQIFWLIFTIDMNRKQKWKHEITKDWSNMFSLFKIQLFCFNAIQKPTCWSWFFFFQVTSIALISNQKQISNSWNLKYFLRFCYQMQKE